MVSVFSVLLRLHIVVADKRLEDGAHAGGLILVVLAPRGAVLLLPLLGVAPLALRPHLLRSSLALLGSALLVAAGYQEIEFLFDVLAVGYVHLTRPLPSRWSRRTRGPIRRLVARIG